MTGGPPGSVPFPYTPLFPASVKVCTAKVAVTVVAAPRVTVQEPVPDRRPPRQALEKMPAAGVAVKENPAPLADPAAEVGAQAQPAGAAARGAGAAPPRAPGEVE